MNKFLILAFLVLSSCLSSVFAQQLTGFGTGDKNPFNSSTDFLFPWTGTVNATSLTVTSVANSGGGIFQALATPVAVSKPTYLTLTGALITAPVSTNFTITIFDTAFNTRVYKFDWSLVSSGGSSVTGTFDPGVSSGAFNGTVGSWELDVGGQNGDTISFRFDDLSFTATPATTLSSTKQTITFPTIPNQVFGAAPITLAATASSGLPVSYTVISGSATLSGTNSDVVTVTGVGTVVLQANQVGNAVFAPAPVVKKTFTVAKATATVALGNLAVTYSGAPQIATVTTTPADLNFTLTYAGKTVAPTAAGSYAVVATVADPNYTGKATGTLVISKAAAGVGLGGLTAFYNGGGHAATAVTNPSGLTVTFTYNGKATLPVALGSYAVVGTVSNANFTGIANGTMTISVAPSISYQGASGAEVTQGVPMNGVATTAYYQYGTTTAYGTQTLSQNLGSGKVPVNIYALFPGLLPNTVYHYRLVTVTAAGTVTGPDLTFTTLDFDTNLIAQKGDAANGTPTTFTSFGKPAVNVNDLVAFTSTLTPATGVTTANNIGIWTVDNSNVQHLIAQIGSAAPDTGGNFLTLADPLVNDSGAVAFRATLKTLAGQVTATNGIGIWSSSSGALHLVARQGFAAPGVAGGTFSAFTQMGLTETKGVVFLAALNAGTGISAANNMGIWEGNTTGDCALVFRLGQVVDGKTITKIAFLPTETYVNGQTRSFNSTGDLVFGATFSDKTTGVVRVLNGVPHVILAKTGAADDLAGPTYSVFANPAINDSGHVAYQATLTTAAAAGVTSANTIGIWADDSVGSRHLVARIGTPVAPGTAANFLTFSDPVYNNNNAVAFRATLKGLGVTTANSVGIWASNGSPNTLALVAQQGVTPAAGCPAGATFATFTELALPDQGGATNKGGAVFLATLNTNSAAGVTTANNLGIWAIDNAGVLQLIVRTGDIINGKVITGLSFLPTGAPYVAGQSRSFSEANGDLVYVATFSDKSTAILNVVFP